MKLNLNVKSIFLSLFLLFIIGGNVSAANIETNGQTPDKVLEGTEINYTIKISDISPAAEKISFDTDLAKVDGFHLYNFTSLNVISDANKFDIPINESTKSITVNIHGQIPQITEKKQSEGITIVKYKSQTGYAYDRIILTNNKGNLIETVETRPFEISIPEVESFREKMNKINDPFFKEYLQSLHDKGLVDESNTLADHLTENNEWPPYWWTIPGLIIGFVMGGLIVGRYVAKNKDQSFDDIEAGEDRK